MKTYTCAMCGTTYNYAWTDEEAAAEKDALWGDVPLDECSVICDDCFKAIVPQDGQDGPACPV